jgi:hypothetical protein
LIFAPSVLAPFSLKLVRHRHIEERCFSCIADEHDVPSLAAVAPRRSTVGDILFPAEGDASVSARPSDDFDTAGVDELHGGAAGL